MPVNVYVYFNGNCRDAVNFYSDVFETEEPKIMTFAEVPPDPEFLIPEDAKNMIIHATLNIKGSTVMFSDVFPGTDYKPGNNVSLTVLSKSLDELLSIYNRLKEDGSVDMELQETFFSKYYGSVTDKYGIPWQLSYDET